MRNLLGWLLMCGCGLLWACTQAKPPDILSQISGVWTEGTANSMVYLNLGGHQKTFAMAAAPGIIYPADVTAIDLQNRIVTVNVSFPGKGSEAYAVRPYVFRVAPVGAGGQFRLVMTAPTGRQSNLSFVRQLSSAELAAQPTQFAVAMGEPELAPAPPSAAPASPPAPPSSKAPPAPQKAAPSPAPRNAAPPPALAKQKAAPPPAPHKALTLPAPQSATANGRPTPPSAVTTASRPRQKARPAPAARDQAQTAQAAGRSACAAGAPAVRHQCAARAFYTADQALNRRYRALMTGLPASRRAPLARQEVQWILRKRRQCRARADRTRGGDLLRRTAQLQCWTQMTRQQLAVLGRYR